MVELLRLWEVASVPVREATIAMLRAATSG